jgi:hypothetical protein
MNHLVDGILVIVAEINDPAVGFRESIAACTIEESTP